ncbi:MAG: zinc ribbon-containing protein [Gammaproteobacteria bacterium]|nr:zinc ribbon-containing protein [Gammaproteobacteria bacterium]
MAPDNNQDPLDRMVVAYENMLQRVDDLLQKAEKTAIPTLKKSLEHAREKAVELDELTREEAEKIASYVERDLHDAAGFLHQTGEEFRDWARFDLKLIEGRILDMFASVADKTRLELGRFAEQAREATFYHTGEITGPGTLVCGECGKELHFHKTGHIPPCSGCHGTKFARVVE